MCHFSFLFPTAATQWCGSAGKPFLPRDRPSSSWWRSWTGCCCQYQTRWVFKPITTSAAGEMRKTTKSEGRRLLREAQTSKVFFYLYHADGNVFSLLQLTSYNNVVGNCDDSIFLCLHPKRTFLPRQFFLPQAFWRSAIVSNLMTELPLLNPPVLGPVDAVRAVLAVVWGHVKLLLFRQRLCIYPRCLVHWPLPDGLPRRAFADRWQDGAPVDVRVAGMRTKWIRMASNPAWHHRKASRF